MVPDLVPDVDSETKFGIKFGTVPDLAQAARRRSPQKAFNNYKRKGLGVKGKSVDGKVVPNGNEEGNNNKNHDTSVNGNTEKKKKRKWSKNIENNNSNNSSRTKKAKCTKQFTTLSSYLCTGYDVYMTNEPNTFTAMAMLHSRVGRVFYFNDDEKYGVVSNNTSKVQLHTLKGINHRFRVFKLT